jgi:hypothetical protein
MMLLVVLGSFTVRQFPVMPIHHLIVFFSHHHEHSLVVKKLPLWKEMEEMPYKTWQSISSNK